MLEIMLLDIMFVLEKCFIIVMFCLMFREMILLGFRYLASSIPLVSLAGVGVGVGMIFSFLLFSISRNPVLSNTLIRWSFIGFSLVEVSGFIGLVFAFLLLYAL
jgi:F-type H+-transporting ATPase subunit c